MPHRGTGYGGYVACEDAHCNPRAALDPAPGAGPIEVAPQPQEVSRMPIDQFIGPSEAAAQLGISPKALRLYEGRGLVKPRRSEAGWRAYGPGEMSRLGEI